MAAETKRPPYDALKDFTPIAALTSQPYVLVAGNQAGVTSVAELIAAPIQGRTTYMFAPISAVTLPHIRDGGLVALAVSTMKRSSLLPGVPTIAEAGVAGFHDLCRTRPRLRLRS